MWDDAGEDGVSENEESENEEYCVSLIAVLFLLITTFFFCCVESTLICCAVGVSFCVIREKKNAV